MSIVLTSRSDKEVPSLLSLLRTTFVTVPLWREQPCIKQLSHARAKLGRAPRDQCIVPVLSGLWSRAGDIGRSAVC